MTTQEKLISFQNFLVIAAADGALQAKEQEELISLGNELGLQPADLKPIVTAESLDFAIHSDLANNKADLGDMLTIAAADGVILKSEYEACVRFANMAGIAPKELEEMLQVALHQSEEEVQLIRE